MKKEILITGSTGFLGSRIIEAYKEEHIIYAPLHEEMDISDHESVSTCLQQYMPDVVIHCAAISDVAACEKDPVKSWNVNVIGSINIAKACNDLHIKCIICSSDQVYFGSNVFEAHKEDEILIPNNLYGKEKLTAEQECLKINPSSVMLRLSWMYDIVTKNPNEHGDFFRTLMTKMHNKEALSYPIYDMRGISDINEVILNLKETFELDGGIYNFGSPNTLNTFDTVLKVFQSLELDTKLLQENRDAFKMNPRIISMCQDKINNHGIYFSSTVDNIIRNIKAVDIAFTQSFQ